MSETPDGCPFHGLAVTDPGATVQAHDEYGRYIGPVSAERACDAYHVGAVIHAQLRAALRGSTTSGGDQTIGTT